MDRHIELRPWQPGGLGKGVISFDPQDHPDRLDLFDATRDRDGKERVFVQQILDLLGMKLADIRVVRIEPADGRDTFWIDNVPADDPGPRDAELLRWVCEREPRIEANPPDSMTNAAWEEILEDEE